MNIALLGYGTVGSGAYEIIQENKKMIKEKYKIDIKVKKILVRSIEKYNDLHHSNLFTTDIDEILEDKTIDVVISVMGGLKPSYKYVKNALIQSKHVITANKDLIANNLVEFSNLANENNVTINYEASVAGGILIIEPLLKRLAGHKINSIYGIINGTTNFILSQMYENNENYESVLKNAQDLGFAESDPTSDVEGLDAARKLAILSMINFNKKINWENIKCSGITSIDKTDISYAKNLNKKIKLFAISEQTKDGIYLGVQPIFINKKNQLAKIDNEYNGIHLKSNLTKDLLYYGKGAGKFPTGSAIFSDLLSILNGKKQSSLKLENAKILDSYPYKTNWFIRFKTKDVSKTTHKIFNKFNDYKFNLETNEFNKEITIKIYDIKETVIKDILKQFDNATWKYFLIIKGD
ncbi:MAG: homoserine dehydrogenase [Bacillota bacterium]